MWRRALAGAVVAGLAWPSATLMHPRDVIGGLAQYANERIRGHRSDTLSLSTVSTLHHETGMNRSDINKVAAAFKKLQSSHHIDQPLSR